MNALLLRLKENHWNTLSAAEQKTLLRGAWILLPLLLYAILWQPAHEALPKLHTDLPRLRAQVDQMEHLARQVQSLRQQAQPAVLDSPALHQAVQKAATAAGLPLQVMPGERNSVLVSADNIAFAAWLNWLRELEHTQHLRVASAMLSAGEAGMVKLQVTLTNGPD